MDAHRPVPTLWTSHPLGAGALRTIKAQTTWVWSVFLCPFFKLAEMFRFKHQGLSEKFSNMAQNHGIKKYDEMKKCFTTKQVIHLSFENMTHLKINGSLSSEPIRVLVHGVTPKLA